MSRKHYETTKKNFDLSSFDVTKIPMMQMHRFCIGNNKMVIYRIYNVGNEKIMILEHYEIANNNFMDFTCIKMVIFKHYNGIFALEIM
eukprot:UN04654